MSTSLFVSLRVCVGVESIYPRPPSQFSSENCQWNSLIELNYYIRSEYLSHLFSQHTSMQINRNASSVAYERNNRCEVDGKRETPFRLEGSERGKGQMRLEIHIDNSNETILNPIQMQYGTKTGDDNNKTDNE